MSLYQRPWQRSAYGGERISGVLRVMSDVGEVSCDASRGGAALNRLGTDCRDRDGIPDGKLAGYGVNQCARNTGGFMNFHCCGIFYPEQGTGVKRIGFW